MNVSFVVALDAAYDAEPIVDQSNPWRWWQLEMTLIRAAGLGFRETQALIGLRRVQRELIVGEIRNVSPDYLLRQTAHPTEPEWEATLTELRSKGLLDGWQVKWSALVKLLPKGK